MILMFVMQLKEKYIHLFDFGITIQYLRISNLCQTFSFSVILLNFNVTFLLKGQRNYVKFQMSKEGIRP